MRKRTNANNKPIVLPQSHCTIEFLDNSHISETALELHSRAAPSVGGITAQSILTQGENPGGRQNRKKVQIAKILKF